jgi:hypothetical protein
MEGKTYLTVTFANTHTNLLETFFTRESNLTTVILAELLYYLSSKF